MEGGEEGWAKGMWVYFRRREGVEQDEITSRPNIKKTGKKRREKSTNKRT